tara:strand:+ start:623 stop:1111 length:489 start_codon:yes stop_codon:yes gene_type:complete
LSSDYGILGLSKAERRDRKRRQAARKLRRYKKCVSKKGADHRRCKKILSRAERKLLKAETLEKKLQAKGKGEAEVFQPSTGASLLASSPVAAASSRVAAVPEDVYLEDYSYEEDDLPAQEDAGVSPIVLALGGLAVVAVGGFLIYSLTKPSKKKRNKVQAAA